MVFVKGQRFISQPESELGLGSVVEFNHRMVKIQFDAVNETRIYAIANAPIRRVVFKKGEEIQLKSGETVIIVECQSINGLEAYLSSFESGEQRVVIETEIANTIKLNKPFERLLNGNTDSKKWFDLKLEAFHHSSRLSSLPLYGLLGCRTSLLKHQLFIAKKVGSRFAPRVLLADEVGLGKTIEAGLIIHQQLITQKAQRVLIIVPESLKHQWMVEMLRRFNLSFTIYDEPHCQAVEESSGMSTPFESSQLGLVSLDFLKTHRSRFEQLQEASWDLLVVDEAHHLQWSEDHVSEEYAMIEKLAAKIKGVLLLTATPEQLGRQSHFARLKLLDPLRFHSFKEFVKQEESYQPIAELISALTKEKKLSESQKNLLLELVPDFDPDDSEKYDVQLINQLLDLHGTGRLLFRNTRSAIQGFPVRVLNAYALDNSYKNKQFETPEHALSPEIIKPLDNGLVDDSRYKWLIGTLRELKDKKILLITRSKHSVLLLAETLRVHAGVHAAVFHEGLSLIERDRSAAWFADPDDGAQLLLCSEIGSEGRNFQFAHHAIFFDLPLNPDLLEQRIGRLDRIGQTHDIQIHVPYFKGSIMEKVYMYHAKGLGIFDSVCPAAYKVFQQTQDLLMKHLKSGSTDEFLEFLTQVRDLTNKYNKEMDSGRDRLLEYNSCREPEATEMYDQSRLWEDSSCQRFMHQMFDLFGVHCEDLRSHVELIRASESMQEHFPGLIEEGMSVTFDRNTALANETLHFLSWEHPMVRESLEIMRDHEKGNAHVCTVKGTGLKPSTLIIEANYQFQLQADKKLEEGQYCAPQPIKTVVKEDGKFLAEDVFDSYTANRFLGVDKKTSVQIIKMKMEEVKFMQKQITDKVKSLQKSVISKQLETAEKKLDSELHRIHLLKLKNPNVRDEEIQHLEDQKSQLMQAIQNSHLQLISVRLLICI